jgi:DNA polymerase-3 subunit alpha
LKQFHVRRPPDRRRGLSNLFALIKLYKAALGVGIKPIVGVEAWVRRSEEPARLVLLCQNLSGYHNLTRLVSRGYLEGQQRGVPVIDYPWLHGNVCANRPTEERSDEGGPS